LLGYGRPEKKIRSCATTAAVEILTALLLTYPSGSSSSKSPSEGKEIPGRDRNDVKTGSEGSDSNEDCTPGLPHVEFKHLLGHRLDDILKGDTIRELLANCAETQLLSESSALAVGELVD
jgi:hypothetical protein